MKAMRKKRFCFFSFFYQRLGYWFMEIQVYLVLFFSNLFLLCFLSSNNICWFAAMVHGLLNILYWLRMNKWTCPHQRNSFKTYTKCQAYLNGRHFWVKCSNANISYLPAWTVEMELCVFPGRAPSHSQMGTRKWLKTEKPCHFAA